MARRREGSKIKTYINVEVRDKNGNLKLSRREEGHSWTLNFAQVLRAMMYGNYVDSVWINIIGTDGKEYFTDICDLDDKQQIVGIMGLRSGDGDDSWGMVIGTNNTSEDPADHNIKSKIPNSKVHYGSTLVSGDVTVSTTGGLNQLSFKVWRSFVNQSGEDVTVYEVGLIAKYKGLKWGGGIQEFNYLIYRHVFSNGIKIADGDILTIAIEIVISLS